jgi:hypothetical protein
MKPVTFKGVNVVMGKNQPEYIPCPAKADIVSGDFIVTTCWKLSLKERILFLFLGRVWIQLMTFGHPMQPIRAYVGVNKEKA